MRVAEETRIHNRILKCTLELEHARSYWRLTDGSRTITTMEAYESFLFGSRSPARLSELLTNLRARFDAFPAALPVLHVWEAMSLDTRRLVCHWHLQLADPLYRRFTGEYLMERRVGGRAEVSRAPLAGWLERVQPGRWAMSTRLQLASKLLTAAHGAGLVASTRDPRPLAYPRIDAVALGYLLYLLRGIDVDGSLLDNPYLKSLGLAGGVLEDLLRRAPGLHFRRQGDLVDFGWQHADLADWARQVLDAPIPVDCEP